jgi:hypothetical protein
VAVLPDQVPPERRGLVSGVLGTCLPIAALTATFLVDLFSGHRLAMFMVPCVVGGTFILLFVANLDDRRLPVAAGTAHRSENGDPDVDDGGYRPRRRHLRQSR